MSAVFADTFYWIALADYTDDVYDSGGALAGAQPHIVAHHAMQRVLIARSKKLHLVRTDRTPVAATS